MIKGFTLQDPLTYAGVGGTRHNGAEDPSQLDPSSEVEQAPAHEPLNYWPWFATLSPAQRWHYLSWLSYGKQVLPEETGFLFLYYYGLERRVLMDKEDHALVVSEMLRFLDLDQQRQNPALGRSYRGYAINLLWMLACANFGYTTPETLRRVATHTRSWAWDHVLAACAWCIANKTPLPSWLALELARDLPESRRSVVIDRVGDSFQSLFNTRYRERFGDGILLVEDPRRFTYRYQPASPALGEATVTIPTPKNHHQQLAPISALWNSCIEDLKKLSKVADTGEDLSVEAYEALPEELRRDLDHPLGEKVTELASQDTARSGCATVAVGKLADLIKIPPRERLTPTQARKLAGTIEQCGHGIEPDARFTGKAYGWNQVLALFRMPNESEFDQQRYVAAACMLRLGCVVALADGSATERELETLVTHVQEAFALTVAETARLSALRTLLLRDKSDALSVPARLQEVLNEKQRAAVARTLVAIAAADGVVTNQELLALRKCYRSLALPIEELDRTLAGLARSSDESLVTVKPGAPAPAAPGEALPRAPTEGGLQLDRAAIRALLAETREVSRILAEAMGTAVQEPPPPPPPEPKTSIPTNTNNNLDTRYQTFFTELTAKTEWSRTDAEQLARKHSHMLGGALEAVNDWAFTALGGPLVDDQGARIVIDRSMLA